MHNDNVFNRLYLWIERYITYAHQKPDEAYDSFCANKDFWDAISDVIRSLSVRKYVTPLSSNNDYADRTGSDHTSGIG